MADPIRPWFENSGLVLAFARHLLRDEGYDGEAILGFFDKPRAWTAEYIAWSLDNVVGGDDRGMPVPAGARR